MNTGDAVAVWEQSLKLLYKKNETKTPLAKVYLNYLVPVSLDEHRLVFAVRLLQAKLWIEKRYLSYISESVSLILESPREILLIVDEEAEHPADSATQNATRQISNSPQNTHQSLGPTQHSEAAPASPQPLQAPISVDQLQATHVSDLPSLQHDAQQTTPAVRKQPTAQSAASPAVVGRAEVMSKGSGLSSVFSPDINPVRSSGIEPNSRFNFSNYVMGNSNEFAYKASLRVAETPGLYFNPLFIYGRSGLGKTHLLLSIQNYIREYLIEKRVVYAPTTEFVNDFTNAMAGDRDLTSFKRKYHTCDVLLVDDVQNLEGKEGTTDALFEIFNMFIESKKQIVLSADRSPVDINLDERFTSRFAQGITADIQPPNYEMKTAILKNYKRYYCNFLTIPEIEFSDEAIQKIVELSGSNIRELEGAVSNLIVSVSCRPDSQKSQPVTYDDVESVLGKSFFHKNTRRVNIDMVMQAVESYFKVSHAELLSEKRSKYISHPRQVAMYLIRRYTDMSYPEIGDSFNKDHTTVMYADKNIQAKMVEEATVKYEVEHIAEMLTL